MKGKVELHVDLEGAFGLIPYGIDYEMCSNRNIEDAIDSIILFNSLVGHNIKIKVYVVGALIDKKNFFDKLSFQQDQYSLESLKKMKKIDKSFFLSMDSVNKLIESGIELHSHTYFHADMKEVESHRDAYDFMVYDKMLFDDIYYLFHFGVEKPYQVAFPQNIIPSCASKVHDNIRFGLDASSHKMHSVMFNVRYPLLYYRKANRSFFYNLMSYAIRHVFYSFSSKSVFYTHCHNLISDKDILKRFVNYIYIMQL